MKRTISTEIIAVGTELLLGQIANTNAQWMSEQLANYGINTYYHTVVGDNLERLTQIFEQAKERSDVVIITGGLGPTEDDLSREAFQAMSHLPIVEDALSMRKIESFYQNRGIQMTPNNRRQARVFEDSMVLENKVGMAPGNIVTYYKKYWVFLPGVPREMKQLFSDDVLPYLKKINGEMVITSTILQFIGIGESVLEDRLSHLISSQHNPTIAPLAKNDGVTIRISAKATTMSDAKKLIEKTKSHILAEVGEYYVGADDDTLEEIMTNLLKMNGKTLASAESLTGGMFADKIVSFPGISQVFKGAIVCYDPKIKEKVLNIPQDLIDRVGTVSEECALGLAQNVRKLMDTSIGISFTGVAGPEKSEGHRVGTVFIGLVDEQGYEYVEKCLFHGDRQQIRYRSVIKGFELLLKYIKSL